MILMKLQLKPLPPTARKRISTILTMPRPKPCQGLVPVRMRARCSPGRRITPVTSRRTLGQPPGRGVGPALLVLASLEVEQAQDPDLVAGQGRGLVVGAGVGQGLPAGAGRVVGPEASPEANPEAGRSLCQDLDPGPGLDLDLNQEAVAAVDLVLGLTVMLSPRRGKW